MAQTPSGSEGDSKPANVSKSWLHLKWNNPENANRLGRASRTVRSCRRCSPSCRRNADCFLCKRLGQVSKVYPKLSVKTTGKGAAKPCEAETASSEESTVEHSRMYRQHWWRCNGPCRNEMPYLGVIRRSTRRPPGPTDKWWSDHVLTCGGTFVKVQNPEVPKTKNQNSLKNGDIRNFLSGTRCSGSSDSSAVSEAADPLFQSEEVEALKNSLLEVGDDVGGKLEGDNKEASTVEGTERESTNENSALKIETFSPEEDGELNDSLLKVCEVVEATLQADDCNEEEALASCLACGVQIFKNQLDLHLINCMKDIFDVDLDGVDEGGAKDGNPQLSCPFCLKSVRESDMKEHVDVCSSTELSATLFIDELDNKF